jgi:hypothetical protein
MKLLFSLWLDVPKKRSKMLIKKGEPLTAVFNVLCVQKGLEMHCYSKLDNDPKLLSSQASLTWKIANTSLILKNGDTHTQRMSKTRQLPQYHSENKLLLPAETLEVILPPGGHFFLSQLEGDTTATEDMETKGPCYTSHNARANTHNEELSRLKCQLCQGWETLRNVIHNQKYLF